MNEQLRINKKRLMERLERMGKVGEMEGGGVCRLALTDEDKEARDLLKVWFLEQNLEITVDGIGNMFGQRKGEKEIEEVMIGSHLDTVGTGGLYDGSLGVLAALEVIQTLNENNVQTKRPISIANFTNEEGVRFTPDMMGSLAFSKTIPLEELLCAASVDGTNTTIGKELKRIEYEGEIQKLREAPYAFLELHIEQGPVLENEQIQIGAVESVQGIYWTEYKVQGVSNHAGTTPIAFRHDAGYVAMRVGTFIRELTKEMGNNLVATMGICEIFPNLINVVPETCRFTVDLRNPEANLLREAQMKLDQFIDQVASEEGVKVTGKELVRFAPVKFDEEVVSLVQEKAKALDLSFKVMPSGAGHDAQMMAKVCSSAMIFIPSKDGISHNINEYSSPEQIEMGANVLLQSVLELANA